MMGGLRLFAMLLIGLTVVYVCLSLYSRSVRRAKLEAEWDAGNGAGDREAHVRSGLERYDGSIRRKLILGVYVVPLSLIGILIYVTNFM
ncbi:MAG: hypothetical protein NXH82_15230 [Rhodobacteraceae bacterium]|nr:hypothetical protein [Paracoccaceae bacterium]